MKNLLLLTGKIILSCLLLGGALSRTEANHHPQALFEGNVAIATLKRAVGITVYEEKGIEKEKPA
jgi:hypothetical protein